MPKDYIPASSLNEIIRMGPGQQLWRLKIRENWASSWKMTFNFRMIFIPNTINRRSGTVLKVSLQHCVYVWNLDGVSQVDPENKFHFISPWNGSPPKVERGKTFAISDRFRSSRHHRRHLLGVCWLEFHFRDCILRNWLRFMDPSQVEESNIPEWARQQTSWFHFPVPYQSTL